MSSKFFPTEKLVQSLQRVQDERPTVYQKLLDSVSDLSELTPEVWQQLPFVTKAELKAVSFTDRLVGPIQKVEHIRHSYGTTSSRILISPRVAEGSYDSFFGDIPVTKIMNFFATGSYDLPGSCLHIPQVQGDSGSVEESALLAEKMGVDGYFLTPYSAMKLAGFLSKEACERTLALVISGEQASTLQLKQLKKHYPNAYIYGYYSSSEAGEIATVCPHDRVGQNFLRLESGPQVYVELINEAGEVIEADATAGEIVITTLHEVPMPLVRYRTGDMAMYSKRGCTCEESARGFTMLGRMDTHPIRIGRGEVSIEGVTTALSRADVANVEYFEVLVGESLEGDLALPKVVINLFTKDAITDATAELTNTLASKLEVYPDYTYADGVEDHYYLPLQLSWKPDNHDSKSVKAPYSKIKRAKEPLRNDVSSIKAPAVTKTISSLEDLQSACLRGAKSKTSERFYFPSTFTPEATDDWFWLDQSINLSWTNLEEAVKPESVKTAVLFLPVAWQLGAPFFRIAHKHRTTVAVFDDSAFNSVELILKNHPVELLVTTNDGLQQLLMGQIQKEHLPKTILLVTQFGENALLLYPDGVEIRYDIHLFPGFSIAGRQTMVPAGETFFFAPNEGLSFEVTAKGTFFSGQIKEFAFESYRLPFELETADALQFTYKH